MKPTGTKNYGSIPHLSNSKLGENDYFITEGQERILTIKTRDKNDIVFVFEKYDGSNVGIAKKDGEIFSLTRSGYEAKTSPYSQHKEFHEWVEKRKEIFSEMLKEGERLVGEWLFRTHGINYEIQGSPIVFFDWFDSNNKRYPFSKLESVKVPKPRLLHKGGAVSTDSLISKLNERTPNFKSIENPEGMVYRVERNGKVDFLAKWVRSDFETGKYIIGVNDSELKENKIINFSL
jgi:hypothetical protein